jgi:hypothetical protein
VSPKNAIETIIRHFTDSQDQKREGKDLTDSVKRQQERAETWSNNAADFSSVMDRILDDHCRAAGVSSSQVVPMLNEQQISEVREFAEKMPYVSRTRRDFLDSARQAEKALQQRGSVENARETQQGQTVDLSNRPGEQSHSEPLTYQRTDRESLSRGR